jgi:DNA-binding LacI/PurR family transcriptional regulator
VPTRKRTIVDRGILKGFLYNTIVAKRAGVSIATVSRVLNDSPHVRPAVKRKVLRAVKALNFQPNRTAQRLRA